MTASRIIALAAAVALSGCVSTTHPAVIPDAQVFDPIAFFAGRTQGVGVLKIALHGTTPTLVEGVGHAAGTDTIVLDQAVQQGSKRPTHRQWRLKRVAPDRYAGTLSDAAGPVAGDVHGNLLHLAFRMKGGLAAEQWLVLRPGGAEARNVMIVRKFGLPVARLDETIRQLPPR